MYKIMFSDLDETLLVNHHVPAFNVEAIKEARKKGVKFVPCTGRAFNMIGEILHFQGLGFDHCKEIFELGKNYDVCVLIFTIDCCYIFNASEDEVVRKTAQKAPFKVIDEYNMDFLRDEKIAKILYQKADMPYLKSIVETIPEDIKDKTSIGYSSNRYIEFNALGVDKGTGMKWLANYLNVDINDTIGIGDNYNDVEMIKTAGLGCVVTCANDDIKALGQYVTVNDYDQGAVKEVIEKFILEEK